MKCQMLLVMIIRQLLNMLWICFLLSCVSPEMVESQFYKVVNDEQGKMNIAQA